MPRILIVDDERDIRKMLRELLEFHGYEVVEAEDGRAGIRVADETLPHLIITDIIMPEQEGLSTIRELKKKRPLTKIIAISGGGLFVSVNYLDLARKLGADRVFSKPLEFEPLLQAIRQMLGS
jgi:two-component system cell cycle response regulator CpdR